ncbi:MAG: hypothetical protein IT348_12025 [Candidatus Eisenbacteria bacterium]|nr:hypothetical protein [Candidatus Eisenbacteria bacterium]
MPRSILTKAGIALGVVLAALVVMALTPVPRATPERCYTVTGRVASVTTPCCLDVSIWLEGDTHCYHINRGVEQGIDVAAWHQRLAGKDVQLKVIRRNWSPLDRNHELAPVAELSDADGLVFTVMEKS